MDSNFSDKIIEICNKKCSRVVLELSASLDDVPDYLKEKYESSGAVLYAYYKGIIDAVADKIVAVSVPIYAFEKYGVGGIMVFDAITKYCAGIGVLVVADGVCGGSKEHIAGYINSFFTENVSNLTPGSGNFYADAVTLSPYADANAIKEAARYALDNGRGIFIDAMTTPSEDKVHFENIVGKEPEDAIYKSAVEDSGEFGKDYIGEKGFGVIGFMVTPDSDADELRKINKWGIAVLKCQETYDFKNESIFRYFYEDDGEGALVLVRDQVLLAYRKGSFDESEFADAALNAIENIVNDVEKGRLSI